MKMASAIAAALLLLVACSLQSARGSRGCQAPGCYSGGTGGGTSRLYPEPMQ